MTTKHAKSRRPARSARLETRVEPRIFEAVEAFAIAKGYTLSSALNRLLLEWEKTEQKKANGKQGG